MRSRNVILFPRLVKKQSGYIFGDYVFHKLIRSPCICSQGCQMVSNQNMTLGIFWALGMDDVGTFNGQL
jgi:hypothetical protein